MTSPVKEKASVRPPQNPAEHRHQQVGVAVLGHRLFEEKHPVAQYGDRAELGGSLDGQQFQRPIIHET